MLRADSIRQMEDVLAIVKAKYNKGTNIKKACREAIEEVSKRYEKRYQTINDLCTRRLNQNIDSFYLQIAEWLHGKPQMLIKAIQDHIDSHSLNEITLFLNSDANQKESSFRTQRVLNEETFSFRLDNHVAKKLKVLAISSEEDTAEWLTMAVTEIINQKYNLWLSEQVDLPIKPMNTIQEQNKMKQEQLIILPRNQTMV
ncbi:MAG: hypothetical protein K9M75_01780 [Phycisphaerae bacterium]|nr:hypothetical protein [Phycisphaerae bacterium]